MSRIEKSLTYNELTKITTKVTNGEQLTNSDIDSLLETAELFHEFCEDATEHILNAHYVKSKS